MLINSGEYVQNQSVTINNSDEFDKKITLAITGASGSAYALRLLECLVAANYQVYLLCSSAARVVFDTEVGLKLPSSPDAASQFFTGGVWFGCAENHGGLSMFYWNASGH